MKRETTRNKHSPKNFKEKCEILFGAILLLLLEIYAFCALFLKFLLNENSKTSEFFRISTTSLLMMILVPLTLITICAICKTSREVYVETKLLLEERQALKNNRSSLEQ